MARVLRLANFLRLCLLVVMNRLRLGYGSEPATCDGRLGDRRPGRFHAGLGREPQHSPKCVNSEPVGMAVPRRAGRVVSRGAFAITGLARTRRKGASLNIRRLRPNIEDDPVD